ncbi:MAG: hypothetical protein M3I20_00645 [Mogibacterium diversum]|uniref:hypothetical protein n=1 Tax=Mogibacterium diversum TaxID=114527 RepID=UPI0020691299|nr:hypothetical protein [Mogibacterium diversum]UQF81532.1 MAG: hypothetical protein M3I20_00645 [Mogibacterium diversum]
MQKTNTLENNLVDDSLQEALVDTTKECVSIETEPTTELDIQIEMHPSESIEDETGLVEITDSKILAQVSNLLPGLFQTGNSINNVARIIRNGPVYKPIIPEGAKLAKSKDVEEAFRGICLGDNGIKAQANFVKVKSGAAIATNSVSSVMNVSSLIVGQYYMKQINAELDVISEGIDQIQNFQDNEYRSKVFSLVAHVKRISNFQSEILENDELRISKIYQLDSLEKDCAELLGQANFALADFTNMNKLSYKEYENVIAEVQKWYTYQKSLIEVMYKISDLRYTLHLGAVSREQCADLLSTYQEQIGDTHERINVWHYKTAKRLGIKIDEICRKRAGLDGAIHFIPGLLKDEYKFRSIDMKTVKMIIEQAMGYEEQCATYTSELYNEDVQLVSKDGRLYYLPE